MDRPDYELADALVVDSAEQHRALGNLTRRRVVVRGRPLGERPPEPAAGRGVAGQAGRAALAAALLPAAAG